MNILYKGITSESLLALLLFAKRYLSTPKAIRLPWRVVISKNKGLSLVFSANW